MASTGRNDFRALTGQRESGGAAQSPPLLVELPRMRKKISQSGRRGVRGRGLYSWKVRLGYSLDRSHAAASAASDRLHVNERDRRDKKNRDRKENTSIRDV